MNILLFGNCQTRVLYHALKAYSQDFNVFYVNEVQNIVSEDIATFIKYLKITDVFIYQVVNKNNFDVGSNCLLEMADQNTLKIIIPSLYFDGYWPNMLDLFMGNQMPEISDGILYKILLEKPNLNSEESLKEYLSILSRCTDELIIEHIEDSFMRLSERESINNVSINLSDWLRLNYKENIHFFTCNHPKKSIFNFIVNQIIRIIEKQHNIPIARTLFYSEYDMSSIDFLYFPPIGKVLNAMGINNIDTVYSKYVRSRFGCGPHDYMNFFSEAQRYSNAISNLNYDEKNNNEMLIKDSIFLSRLF